MDSVRDWVACSQCFRDEGLRTDASHIGAADDAPCPTCGSGAGLKLTEDALEALAHRYFVWGSLHRTTYGAAPVIQFNRHQQASIAVRASIEADLRLIERLLGVGFFYYGPRMWMIGHIVPLIELQDTSARRTVIERVLREYPARTLGQDTHFYRIRIAPRVPGGNHEYDSPPDAFLGSGRFDSPGFPVLYGSPDLQVCLHECRVAAEDDLYMATLGPASSLRVLDLSTLLVEDVTEFESLDLAIHMLFLAGKHSYDIARDLAKAAHAAGFDGLVYPSYFSMLRTGHMPFETAYGLSLRRFPSRRKYEQAKVVQNLAAFGRPIQDGRVEVRCIDRLMLNHVEYSFHFGPVDVERSDMPSWSVEPARGGDG